MSSHQPLLVEISGVILVASYSRAFELDLGQGHHRGSKNTREPQLASLGEETVTPTIGDGMGHKCMRHACDHSPHKGMHHAHSRIRSILGQGHHTSLISVPEIAWMELFNSAPTETACEGWLTKCMCLQPTKLGSPSILGEAIGTRSYRALGVLMLATSIALEPLKSSDSKCYFNPRSLPHRVV